MKVIERVRLQCPCGDVMESKGTEKVVTRMRELFENIHAQCNEPAKSTMSEPRRGE